MGSFLRGMENLIALVDSGLKRNPEDYMHIDSIDDNHTFTFKDGSLMTVLRVFGSKTMVGEEEFESMLSTMSKRLKIDLTNGAHDIQCVFVDDPDSTRREIEKSMRPCRDTAARLNLDFQDIFDDEVETLVKHVSTEKCFLALLTRPKTLSPDEVKHNIEAIKEALNGINPPQISSAPNLFNVMETLRIRHGSFVDSLVRDMRESFFLVSVLDAHSAAWEMRHMVDPEWTDDEYRMNLVGDAIPLRILRRDPEDQSGLIWPTVRSQMCPRNVDRGTTECRIGDRVYAPMFAHLQQRRQTPFQKLLLRMRQERAGGERIPWRLSFNIATGGLAILSIKTMFNAIFAFMSPTNNYRLRDAVIALQDVVKSGDDVDIKLRVDIATWAPVGEEKLLQLRAQKVARAFQAWGEMDIRTNAGDSVESTLSSCLGITMDSIATPTAAACSDVIISLPIFRPASPWEVGSVLLRTPDGKIFPYQPFSNQQTSCITLMIAEPRYGKTLLANCINFALIVAPGNVRLPRIGIIDFGSGSSGLISLLQHALPINQRHYAQLIKMQMSEKFQTNIFDTQLGCRFPIGSEKTVMLNIINTLLTIDGMTAPVEGMTGLALMAIDELYRMYSDEISPKPFQKNVPGGDVIAKALSDYGIVVDNRTTWWEVVDKLYDAGAIHEALLAQRFAVPTIPDLASIVRGQQFNDMYGDKATADGEPIIQCFSRMISEAVTRYPILKGETKFDVGDARVLALDIEAVMDPQNHGCQQNAMVLQIAINLVGRNLLLNKDLLPSIPARYRGYHEKRIMEIREDLKAIQVDEYHRGSAVVAVQKTVDVFARQGGKNQIGTTLISQHVKDFPPELNEFATVKMILSPQSDKSLAKMRELFEISPTMEYAIKNRIKAPGPEGSTMFAMFKTKEHREISQLLMNTCGGIKLWAFSTTNEDMIVRDELYERIGQLAARKVLRKLYPEGSIRAEVERLRFKRQQSGQMLNDDEAESKSVIMSLVDQIEGIYKKSLLEVA